MQIRVKIITPCIFFTMPDTHSRKVMIKIWCRSQYEHVFSSYVRYKDRTPCCFKLRQMLTFCIYISKWNSEYEIIKSENEFVQICRQLFDILNRLENKVMFCANFLFYCFLLYVSPITTLNSLYSILLQRLNKHVQTWKVHSMHGMKHIISWI